MQNLPRLESPICGYSGPRTDSDAERKDNETQSWFANTDNARGRLRSAADGTSRVYDMQVGICS